MLPLLFHHHRLFDITDAVSTSNAITIIAAVETRIIYAILLFPSSLTPQEP